MLLLAPLAAIPALTGGCSANGTVTEAAPPSGDATDTDAGSDGGRAASDAPSGDAAGDAQAPNTTPSPTSTNPTPKVTECSRAPMAPPASGTCQVTHAGGAAKVLRGTILAPEETLHRGEVLVSDAGTILCVGCDCAGDPAYAAATVIECANGVISPGLINAHDHITYANNAPVGHGTERYEHRHDWRKGAHGHTKLTVKGGASALVKTFAELRFVMSGATSLAAAGGAKGLARNLDDTVDELEHLPAQVANSDTFPLADSNGTLLTSGCAYPSGQTTTEEATQVQGYLPHISEGIDVEARNEFLCANGGGHNDIVQSHSAIIHAVGITAEDAAAMRKDGARVVWSPRSNVDLYGNTAPVTLLDMSGVPIALGTDWVASGSMNLLRELRCADSLNKTSFGGYFTDADLWRMVTTNAALAVGAGHAIGMLKPGYLADIAVFDASVSKDHRAVLDAGVEDVALVLRGGEPLYGDDALVADAAVGGAACEPIAGDVCGRPKRACVAQDIGGGTTLAQVRAAGEAIYPLFFCKDQTPSAEPSCVPYRDTYPNGPGPQDRDGDGVSDATDDCPAIFDPVRPLDQGAQADADKDGIGDACDACPLDASNACARPSAVDLDGDGALDAVDVCPRAADPAQADADHDGRGDACDTCADANPGATPCASTIAKVRDVAASGHPAVGSVVTLSGAYVTQAKSGAGFYLQADGASPAPFSGVFVDAGSTGNALAVGNRVSVVGVYAEIYGTSQITPAVITVENGGTTLPFAPLALAPADLVSATAGEGYEGMLVTVAGPLTITNDDPDAPGKYYEFVVNGTMRVDDQLFARYGAPSSTTTYPLTGYTNGTSFGAITGIAGWSHGNRKLWPRGAADLTH